MNGETNREGQRLYEHFFGVASPELGDNLDLDGDLGLGEPPSVQHVLRTPSLGRSEHGALAPDRPALTVDTAAQVQAEQPRVHLSTGAQSQIQQPAVSTGAQAEARQQAMLADIIARVNRLEEENRAMREERATAQAASPFSSPLTVGNVFHSVFPGADLPHTHQKSGGKRKSRADSEEEVVKEKKRKGSGDDDVDREEGNTAKRIKDKKKSKKTKSGTVENPPKTPVKRGQSLGLHSIPNPAGTDNVTPRSSPLDRTGAATRDTTSGSAPRRQRRATLHPSQANTRVPSVSVDDQRRAMRSTRAPPAPTVEPETPAVALDQQTRAARSTRAPPAPTVEPDTLAVAVSQQSRVTRSARSTPAPVVQQDTPAMTANQQAADTAHTAPSAAPRATVAIPTEARVTSIRRIRWSLRIFPRIALKARQEQIRRRPRARQTSKWAEISVASTSSCGGGGGDEETPAQDTDSPGWGCRWSRRWSRYILSPQASPTSQLLPLSGPPITAPSAAPAAPAVSTSQSPSNNHTARNAAAAAGLGGLAGLAAARHAPLTWHA
ncbi:hypothetical protein C1H76_7617 [Elsinoe australis]|uniref:Uncharacterized protein n=1 Tax=Elsinoe australis TaxID=40998 RepID=A0A4U7APV4_9PEZI|nr:hypothetical protein C1H76_7617 [Elsinoe australis]